MVKPTAGTGAPRAEHLHQPVVAPAAGERMRQRPRRGSRRRGRCSSRAAGRSPPRSGLPPAARAPRSPRPARAKRRERRRRGRRRARRRSRRSTPGASASSALQLEKARRSVSSARRADTRLGERALIEEALGDLLGGAARALGMAVRGEALLEQRDQRGAVVALGGGADFRVEPHVLRRRAARRGGRDSPPSARGSAEGAAQPPPPRLGQAERREQRGEEADVAEADGERRRRHRSPPPATASASASASAGDASLAADILVAGLQPLRRTGIVAAEDEALIGVARRRRRRSAGARGRREW